MPKTAKVANLASGGHDRHSPRTCSPKITDETTLRPEPVDTPELRAQMKELLDFILHYCETHITEEDELGEETL